MTKEPLKRRNLENPQIKSYVRAIEKGKNSQHVMPVSNGWAVKRVIDSRVIGTFDTQKKAICYAKDVALSVKSDLFIHGKDGRIRDRISYGN
jgi:hypothetical protein